MINVLIIIAGIFKDPGIPQSFIDKTLKQKDGKTEESIEEDLEKSSITEEKQEEIPEGKYWCNDCKIMADQKKDRHCNTCGVCIEGYDHHCVFFGKCFGRGNVIFFLGTVGGVIFNVLLVYALALLSVFYADKFADGNWKEKFK